MTTFTDLLELQARDTQLDQLRHRLANLPERARVAELEDELAALERRRSEVEAAVDEVTRRQAESERETAATEARIAEIDRRMRQPGVAARDVVAMQQEVDHLRERQSGLEDRTLEAMEEREPLDEQLTELNRERARLDDEAGRARAALAEAEAEVVREIEAVTAERGQLAGSVPAPLLAEYDRLRERLGGVGAAALVGPSCGGCHLTLPATELDRIRKLGPDELAYCDQCGRILVRQA